MRSSCSVCKEWNLIISNCRPLQQRRKCLDPRELCHKYSFSLKETKQRLDPYPVGICTIKNRVMITDYNYGIIQVFNQDGRFIRKHNYLYHPFGVCLVGEDLWVVSNSSRTIQVLNPVNFYDIDTISLGEFSPRGICSSPAGLIFVTTDENKILTLDQSGHIINQFGSHGDGNGQFDRPYGICCNSRNKIIISDYFNHRVQAFSQDGEFLHTLASEGSEPNGICFPRGICIDRDDNVYVADYGNHRISIFDIWGVAIQQIPIFKPLAVCLSNERLIVTSDDDSVGIFSH